jgi:hypothetical protein
MARSKPFIAITIERYDDDSIGRDGSRTSAKWRFERLETESRLRAELQTVDQEVANLTRAIAAGGQLEPLLAELNVRQDRCQQLRARLAAWAAFSPGGFNRKTIEAKVQAHLQRWRGLLTKHVEDGRQFFREALKGPLRFAPERRTYRFEGELAVGRLLGVAGLVAPLDSSPTGFEPL